MKMIQKIIQVWSQSGFTWSKRMSSYIFLTGIVVLAVILFSTTASTTVTQDGVEPDIYEEDDTLETAGVIVIDDSEAQRHNFHDAGDEDWVQFYGLEGENYTVKASNLEANCDIVINLYNADGDPVFNDPVDDFCPGKDETCDWKCPEDGVYYFKFINYDPTIFGEETGYDVQVFRLIAPLSGTIVGTVSDAGSCQPIKGATIKTSGAASALSLPTTGNYRIIQEAGSNVSITATCVGYKPKSYSGITVPEGDPPVIIDFKLTPTNINDLDDNGKVDITDIMRVASRWKTQVGDLNYDASCDLDNNGKIDIVDIMMVAAQWGWEACG